jgi:hypothetical protein
MTQKQEQEVVNEAPQVVVTGYRFSPDLMTINSRELAFILYRMEIILRPDIYDNLGNLQRHFRPVVKEVNANVQQESQGQEATAASS